MIYYNKMNTLKVGRCITFSMIKGMANRLKDLRTQNRLTQKQVANILDISPSIVSAYETGERTPSAEMLLALSYLYKCSTDYLLGKNNDAPCYYLDAYGLTDAQIKALENLINTMKAE